MKKKMSSAVSESILFEQEQEQEQDHEHDHEHEYLDETAQNEGIAPSTYLIKPALQHKFRAQPVKNIIKTTLSEYLQAKEYSADKAREWTKGIADIIRDKVRELNFRRYKIIVQVQLGEQKGAGVKSGIRCLWDSECDSYASEFFINESIFCLAVVYAVYFY